MFLIAYLILFLNFSALQSNPALEVRNILDSRDQMIKELLGPKGSVQTEEQREKLKQIINDIVDYPNMAKVALDTYFDQISTDQQIEFTELFAQIIRQHSLSQLDIYRAQLTYEEITVNGSTALVTTIAVLDNVRTPVRYRMHKTDGVWMIADMSVDNVWTAESYRRSFQNIIRRRGFDALLDSLRRRASE